jgi:hypothetical protein
VLGFLSVVLQRFQLPGIEVPVATIILLVAAAVLVVSSRQTISPLGLVLFAGLAATASVSTLLGFLMPGLPTSIASLGFLLATYLSTVAAVNSPADHNPGLALFQGAVFAITIGTGLAVAQYLVQMRGGGYLDAFATVPVDFLVPGYNTYYDLEWSGGEAGEYKPNGMIFLEPSFLSIYAVIALIFTLGRLFTDREDPVRWWDLPRLAVLAGGFAVSASASGLAVLGIAAIPLLLSIRRRLSLAAGLALALVGATAAGVFGAVGAKASEGFSGNTSSALRLTLPYEYLVPVWADRPWFGWGSGTAPEAVGAVGLAGLQTSTLMKMLVEYGVVGAVVIVAIIVARLLRSSAPVYLLVAVVATWLIPSDSLLNGSVAMLLLLALPSWRTPGAADVLAGRTSFVPERGDRLLTDVGRSNS